MTEQNCDNTIEGMSPGESVIYEVRRHYFGLLAVYAEVGLGFLAGVAMLLFLAPTFLPNSTATQQRGFVVVIAGLLAIVLWLVLVLFTYIYRQSKLIITNKNLTQVTQQGLFRRTVSELSMADVENVTASQSGFFPSVLGYGALKVETAGEAIPFDFQFCPKPNFYGKIILDARQAFLDDCDNPTP